MSDIQCVLDAMRDRPETFSLSRYTLHDTITGITFWVCNGWGFYEVYSPTKVSFGLVDQFRFDAAFKRWRRGLLSHLYASHAPEAWVGK